MKLAVSTFAALSLLAASALADPLTIPNGGFEQGKTNWTDDKGASTVTKEAASQGNGGLRIVDTNETDYVRVMSEAIPVTPGKTYQLGGMFNQVSGHGVNAILWFLDKDKEIIPWPDGGRLLIRPADGVTGWQKGVVSGQAPENAAYAQVHVQSNRIAIATVDWDEFTLKQVD